MKQILRGAMGPALIPFFACPVITNLQLYITMTRPLRIWLRDHICAPTNYVKLSLLSSHSKCMFSHVTFCVQMENRSSTAEYRCPSANCSTRDATDANYSSKHWRPALEDISSFFVDSRSQQIRLLLPPRFVKSPQQFHWCTVGANRCQSNRSCLSSAHFFGLYS